MQREQYQCDVPGCDAEHDSWHRVAICIHCDAVVCRADCYKELPTEQSFMNQTRECPECGQPMDN
jgi:hypothetical protein